MSDVVRLPKDVDAGSAVAPQPRLWHVTLTVAGTWEDVSRMYSVLVRLLAQRPFIHSCRYDDRRVEIRYWEESVDMLDAASLALRLWQEHRKSAGLPNWEVVGLEVVDRDTHNSRGLAAPLDATCVVPQPF